VKIYHKSNAPKYSGKDLHEVFDLELITHLKSYKLQAKLRLNVETLKPIIPIAHLNTRKRSQSPWSPAPDKISAMVCNTITRYNWPADWARALFKPSLDSVTLLVSMKKYLIWVWGFLLVTSQREHIFECFTHFNWPWAPIQWAFFGSKLFWKQVDCRRFETPFLPGLPPGWWPEYPVVHKNPKTAEKIWVSYWRRRLC